MIDNYENFIFEDYQFDWETKKLTLDYSFDGKVKFQEKIIFDFPFSKNYDEEMLHQALFSLWIMAGISYFKATIPPNIIIKKGRLTSSQKSFFQKIYRHGLGEFFFQNNIAPAEIIGFEKMSNEKFKIKNELTSDYSTSAMAMSTSPIQYQKMRGSLETATMPSQIRNSNSIIPLGGGKDSLTTIELLNAQGLDFETITIDSDERFQAVSKLIGKSHIEIKRTISPELIRINKAGALNGHVPISSIWAFIFVVTAVLKGKQNIILSNEHSANEATTEYMGIPINHQYSKTLEFEQDLQAYISENISPNIHYFSFLRPLTELHIAQIFCSEERRKKLEFNPGVEDKINFQTPGLNSSIFDKYKDNFSSCNKNFKIDNQNKHFTWCAKCPKCAFVFTIFAPFLKKEKLIKLFDQNLFTNPELTNTFDDLLGLTDSKPFECVGEMIEVRKAMIMAREKFPEVEKFLEKLTTKQIKEAEKFDYQKLDKSSMPKEFLDIFPSSHNSFK